MKCATCGSREAGKRCSNCRRVEYARSLGRPVGTCRSCRVLTPLASHRHDQCKKCAAAEGWKYCKSCENMCLIEVEFQAKQSVCRSCRNEELWTRRVSARLDRLTAAADRIHRKIAGMRWRRDTLKTDRPS